MNMRFFKSSLEFYASQFTRTRKKHSKSVPDTSVQFLTQVQDRLLHRMITAFLNFQNAPGSLGAPLSMRSFSSSKWPFSLAMNTGVVSFVLDLRFAPFSINKFTVASSPDSTAAIKGSSPSWAFMLGSAPLLRRYLQKSCELKAISLYEK